MFFPVDWLLKTALEQLPTAPKLPASSLFPGVPRPEGQPPLLFADIAASRGVDRLNGNGTCSWGDYDGDGDLDLFLAGSGLFSGHPRNAPWQASPAEPKADPAIRCLLRAYRPQ